jgi:hypothetical protein
MGKQSDPDPWCEEADGNYEPPPQGEQIDVPVTDMYDRWNDTTNDQKEGK